MDQETQILIQTLVQRVVELERVVRTFNNNATIPLDIGAAFRDRILGDVGLVITSSKSATSENKTVNEAGAAAYSVMDKPDGFLQVTINGSIYYLPYFS